MPEYRSPLPDVRVTSVFGQSRPGEVHKGVDLGAPNGTTITNMADGTVTEITGQTSTWGNSVVMDYGDGVTARFAHMQSPPFTVDASGNQVPLQVGSQIKGGDVLGAVGSTGKSTGPHLHLQMAQDGNPFNPMDAIYNKVSPPDPSQATRIDPNAAAKGTTGSPQNAKTADRKDGIKTLQEFDVPDMSNLAEEAGRDKDADIAAFSADWTQPQDIHDSYFATAEIRINDVIVCPLIPQNPTTSPGDRGEQVDFETPGYDLRLEEFQYRSTTQSGNKVLFRLFVKAWRDVVEMMALAAQKSDCEFKFGYTNVPDGFVGPFRGTILGITPEFRENGYSVSVEAIDKDAAQNLAAGSKTYGWRAQSGRVSDIVHYIAKKNGWRVCIEPTIPLDPHTLYLQQQQTDLNFFNYVLAPKARSQVNRDHIKSEGGQGYGPYTAYLHPDPRSGAPILHFHPRLPSINSKMSQPQREYVWGGVQDPTTREYGTVISFNTTFDNTAFAMLGGAKLAANSMDVTKRLFHSVEAEGSDFDEKQMNGNPIQRNMSSSDPTRAGTYHDDDPEFLRAQVAARFFILRDYALGASMSVLGDPYLRGGIMVNVQVVRPIDGSIMFYDWFVREAIHTISNGEYTVTLDLIRSPSGPAPRAQDSHLPGFGAGLGHYNQKVTVKTASKTVTVGKKFLA